MSKAKLKQQESTWTYIQEPSILGQKDIVIYVTEFEKRGLIHVSNFSTLRPTAFKFGSKTFLSLY